MNDLMYMFDEPETVEKKSIDVVSVRLCREREFNYKVMKHSDDAAIIIQDFIKDFDREVFGVLCLAADGSVNSISIVSMGELTNTPIHPREVYKVAILSNAAAVIFFHNHPSGDPSPSMEDINSTRRLIECGKILGFKVIDHIVIGDNCFVSMRGKNIIEFN